MANAYDYGRQGNTFDAWRGALSYADLQGLDTNVLSGEQHNLVAAYVAATGQNIDPSATLNSDNYGRDYWMNLYTQAQQWMNQREQEFASGRADYEIEVANTKQQELMDYASSLEAEYGANAATQYAQLQSQLADMQAGYNESMSLFQEAQQQASVAQQRAEEQRSAEESRLAKRGVGVEQKRLREGGFITDDDAFQGEMSQFGTYWSELSDQLGTQGYDISALLGDEYSGIDESISGAFSTQSEYENFLSEYAGRNVGQQGILDEFGSGSAFGAYADNLVDQYQQQYDSYSTQIQDSLSNLGSIYQAYSSIGNLDNALGAKADLGSMSDQYASYASDYQDYANKLAGLYSTENTSKGLEILNQYTGNLAENTGEFEAAQSDYTNMYNDYYNQLQGLYGNVEAVKSGLFSNTASNLSGQLQTSASSLGSLLGEQENELMDLQNLYSNTVSQFVDRRLAEKQSLLSQRQQNKANRQRNTALTKSGQRSPQARTVGLSSNLTRGYSLLGA